ncbi:MAG: UvrD-helicase domain-containing protein [Zoogloeaceae bacterium]|jgi:ATP-dependent DNA helicase Rep|nr:UvrD-helicase domain-containing protein [Zoogloeaceae bacterium]
MHDLNVRQREATQYLDGPLLVLAGAGSGKTRVITRKIAWLVRECGLASRRIAAITFTNKAAREMRERAGELLSKKTANDLQVSTFHALGARILREEASALGYKPRFSIFDAADCTALLADLFKELEKGALRQAQQHISTWKNAMLAPEAAQALAENGTEQRAARIYLAYEASLKAYQAMDFDDLIRLPVQLFMEHPEIREKWQDRLRYLLIDEYQDTNACQYALLQHLTGPRQQFTAVGDDDQSIYGWRGADPENLKRLSQDFPNLKIIKLEQNYRSTTRILEAANRLIAHNEKLFEKKLWSELGHGSPVRVTQHEDHEQEAESVVMRLNAHRLEHRGQWSDYAILYRSNHLARFFESALRNQRIPYVLSGGSSFFDKTEIKDFLAYLRLFANPEDDPAFIRAATTPRRGIGSETLKTLGIYAGERRRSLFHAAGEEGLAQRLSARQHAPLAEFCQFIVRMRARAEQEAAQVVLPDLLTAIEYESYLYAHEEERVAAARWTNLCEFSDWLRQKGETEGKTLVDLVQTIALIQQLDKEETTADAVQLSTLHAAKGLEYRHVFLVGVEEEILPHREAIASGTVEEERRLMYVGITRARQSLFISCARRRKQHRDWVFCAPSRFIAEMGAQPPSSTPLPDKATGQARLNALKAMLAGR